MGNIVSSNKVCGSSRRSSSDSDEMVCNRNKTSNNLLNKESKQQEQSNKLNNLPDEAYFNQNSTTVELRLKNELPQKVFEEFISKINIENKATTFRFEASINIKQKSTNILSRDSFKARSVSQLTNIIEKKYKDIKELRLAFPSQSESNNEIDMEPIYSICSMLSQLKQLETLSLNFFQWGYYNSNIKTECLTILCSAITKLAPHLKSLKLDFGRWGCEKYGNLKIYSDDTISSFCEMIISLKQLKHLDINLRSWGYENYKITNKSVIEIFQSVGTLQNLVKLKINLTKWGYLNNNISENSLQDLKHYFDSLKNLKKIYLNFDLWTHLHNYKYIKEALVQLPLLEKCRIDTTEEQNEVVKLYELINYRKKNYLMASAVCKSNLCDIYRQEILWDALRVCMQDNKC